MPGRQSKAPGAARKGDELGRVLIRAMSAFGGKADIPF